MAWFVCAESGQPKLASTVVAGMEAITVPGGRETADAWTRDNYAAVFAAVFYWSVARARATLAGREVPREPSLNRRRDIISLLNQARRTVSVAAPPVASHEEGEDRDEEALAWKGWADLKPRDFNGAVSTVEQRGWLGDWWTGIDDVVKAKDWDGKDSNEDGDDTDADLTEPIRVRRADTMLQLRYDYLSAARKAQYETWRADLLARITTPAPADGGAMEVDSH